MRRRTGFLYLTGALTFVFQAMMGGTALAHHPDITAAAVCNTTTNVVSINYTSTSWSTGIGGANPNISILFNNVAVDSGAYVAPTFAFSGSKPAPLGSGPGDVVTVTALAVGNWDDNTGGGQSASVTVTIPMDSCIQPGLGRFTGGGSQIQIGTNTKITKGLTIHCDLLLSNNLEINWAGGNNFHMQEHMTTVSCTDNPAIIQAPPAAPLDTLVGIGIGVFNGVEGYTVNFTLEDDGEPGTYDRAALYIYETANPAHVVLNLPLQVLKGGNLQAHYDQPHK